MLSFYEGGYNSLSIVRLALNKKLNQIVSIYAFGHSVMVRKTSKRTKTDEASVQGNSGTQDVEDIVKKEKWEPQNWNLILNAIREMRSKKDAPVDTMGCDQCADNDAPESAKRFHILLALMLSSQTKDQVTYAAMARLRGIDGGLSAENVQKTSDEELGRLIYPVGFWKTKAKHIKKTCEVLIEKWGGDIPDTLEGLCQLPGVGPKMAHLCMVSAWGIVTGIGVDTHVHRISNRLGWVRKTKTPEKTRTELEAWLPHPLWQEVNHLLVGLGQTICKPIKPNCQECLAKEWCPSSGKEK